MTIGEDEPSKVIVLPPARPKQKRDGKNTVPASFAREKEVKVYELRKAGATFDEIAQVVGYSSGVTAYEAYKRVMVRLNEVLVEHAMEVRTTELGRLDTATRAIWQRVVQGDLLAIDRMLRIMERRARLLGLDAPQRSEVDLGPVEVVVRRVNDWEG
jgi:hypothetical protein